MSLQDELRKGLYDKDHKPRLAYAKSFFLDYGDREADLAGLKDFYVEWKDYDEYMVIQKQTDNLRIIGEVDKETFAVKCSKRGNDVYWWRVYKRLEFLNELEDITLFDPHSNIKQSNVIFATLTYDVNRCSIREAWETKLGDEFNNWIRNLRKKYGRISYLRGWESSQKGYPHIHILMIFHDYSFKVAFSQLKGHRQVYRIDEKEEFEKSWHSFVDVQAIRKIREGISYVTKYMTKTKYQNEKQVLTLALCWLFEKRSFAVSGDFHDIIYAVTKSRQLVQIDLFGKTIDIHCKWILIGIYSANFLRINPSRWHCSIDLDVFNIYWEENERFAVLERKQKPTICGIIESWLSPTHGLV